MGHAHIGSYLWALALHHAALDLAHDPPRLPCLPWPRMQVYGSNGERGQSLVDAVHSPEPSWEVARMEAMDGKEPGLPPVGPDAGLMMRHFRGRAFTESSEFPQRSVR